VSRRSGVGPDRSVLLHVAVALARYVRLLRSSGRAVPAELVAVVEVLGVLVRPALPRLDSPSGGGGNAVPEDAGVVEPRLLTKQAAAWALSMKVRSVERLIAAGELPVVRIGRSVRVRRSDLDAYVDHLPTAGGGVRCEPVSLPRSVIARG